ncbi:MAG TPA: long-chain fatty aldehyde decarbonylase [Stellaceae bacterium]|nr:long-chain fatty aldehyde decarbonylase [Stellaceae bacterium]
MDDRAAAPAVRSADQQDAIDKLMGLAVFGEKVAARIYYSMAEIKPEFAPLLKKFARMEAGHGAKFLEANKVNGIVADRDFADNELGYLLSQADAHAAAGDFNALAVLQGFIVESLAIATYESFLTIADAYPGTHEVFSTVLAEEHYHVDWVSRYLRLEFFDAEDDFRRLVERVNVQGIDCVGGTMMNISHHLDTICLSGSQCAGAMMDGYAQLLQNVGFEEKAAMKHVVGLFMPLIQKYRRGEKTK